MTVASTQSRKTFAGDAVTTSFGTSPIVFFDTSDLEVRITVNATGVSTLLVENTDYSVTGDGALVPAVGTVSLAGGSSPHGAVSSGSTLVITRVVPLTQEVDFVQNDPSDADVAESTIDKLTMIAQQHDDTLGRSFTLADGDVSGASTQIPTPTAGKLIGWNGTAAGLQNYSAVDVSLVTLPTVTAKGDIFVATAAGVIAKKAVGAKGSLLVPDATQSDGLVWKTVGSNGQTVVTDSTQNDGLIWTDYTREPLNINPNWLLDQINEGALYTVNTTGVQGPDGWTGNATGAGVFKLRTLADPDNAALKCLEISCTTADAAIAAGDNYNIKMAIEGYDAAGLKSGTASASQITVQFRAKSNSVTGVFGVAVQNSAANRRYIGTITIADTAEHDYSVTLTLDTSGTWLYTAGAGLVLILTLAAGSTFQSTAGSWAAGAEQTTSAQANFMSANTNILYLKRFHVLPGGVALAYSMQDITREFRKAQRHFRKSWEQGVATLTGTGNGYIEFSPQTNIANGAHVGRLSFDQDMRAAPTVVVSPFTTPANTSRVSSADGTDLAASSGQPIGATNSRGFTVVNNSGGPITPGSTGGFIFHYTANARLA